MSELEIVLVVALIGMLYLWKRENSRAEWFKYALVAVGKKEAYVLIDKNERSFCIKEVKHD
jgi:hypothetical protein